MTEDLETCERCGGSGCEPIDSPAYNDVPIEACPLACADCGGRGRPETEAGVVAREEREFNQDRAAFGRR